MSAPFTARGWAPHRNAADTRHRAMADAMTVVAAAFLRAHKSEAASAERLAIESGHSEGNHAARMLGRILSCTS